MLDEDKRDGQALRPYLALLRCVVPVNSLLTFSLLRFNLRGCFKLSNLVAALHILSHNYCDCGNGRKYLHSAASNAEAVAYVYCLVNCQRPFEDEKAQADNNSNSKEKLRRLPERFRR